MKSLELGRYLLVGDVHAVVEELEDCRALMAKVKEVALKERCIVVLLGDQTNTHNVIRSEVLWFWRGTLKDLRDSGIEVICLVGNHDYAGEGLQVHAMAHLEDIVKVVDAPYVENDILFLPYYADRETFVLACQEHPTQTVVCHQTFHGAAYENGFECKDGIDPGEIPQETILSGHIHTKQAFGKVTYIGAPRWRTLSDANVSREIVIYKQQEHSRALSRVGGFDTGEVCRQIRYLCDTPKDPVTETPDPKHDWRIDIKGPPAWIEERKAIFAPLGVKVRTFSTERVTPKVRESEGIGPAFRKYLSTYRPKFGTDLTVLKSMTKERVNV